MCVVAGHHVEFAVLWVSSPYYRVVTFTTVLAALGAQENDDERTVVELDAGAAKEKVN